ncbi:Min9p NDAI_0C00145 [Naumovozyma dairenensis CBS 421]|uniref:Uncharacterized protein n=1 Tax=Naumovozyma dairenensis (strain ATCC 10597 / BCRC 20456 / CBS 421 / NBRC 0211 / NRRL Y-12639) TaxID=1071378 RepID=G0W7B4_NAUDC|nr:hypothetical protein NDAI_0C00145 [Naumovozyma dairenensis CBS 421]CCD23675.1 hypothetical protein NDAI_0C00145 [Naumovozyma dairenensis CBS 421]
MYYSFPKHIVFISHKTGFLKRHSLNISAKRFSTYTFLCYEQNNSTSNNEKSFHTRQSSNIEKKSKQNKNTKTSLLLLGLLAIGTTFISISYSKGEPEEYLEKS